MKKWNKLLLAIVTCLTVIGCCFNTTYAKEAFNILNHKVDVIVKENGELEITESLAVHFTARRHGIYVNIPKQYQMDWDIDGKTVTKNYYFPVKDTAVLSGHSFTENNEHEYFQFVLGNEDYYANEYETYTFKYTIATRDLDLDGIQMLLLNLVTDGWDTTTQNLDFTIVFPKSFDASEISVYYPGGVLTGAGSNKGLTVEVYGNVISGSYNNVIEADESITIRVGLPEGYFQFENLEEVANRGLLVGLFCAIISTVVFLLVGRDDPVVVTTEYHTPADLDSAQVGVIINEQVNDYNVLSLLLDWGRRGVITINETEDGLVLKAVGEPAIDALDYEKTLYDGLFADSKEIKTSELPKDFYKTFAEVKQKLENYYKDSVRELSTKASKRAALIAILTSWIPVTIAATLLNLYYYWTAEWLLVLFLCGFFTICCTIIFQQYVMDIYVSNKAERILLEVLIAITLGGPLAYLLFLCIIAKISILTYLAIVFIQLVVIIEAAYMRKRTIYGNSMLGRVLGLREFIMNASQKDLEELLEINPFYFYDILPYAYSINLDDTWNENFKDLTVRKCDWYVPIDTSSSFNTYHMTHAMGSSMRTICSDMNRGAASSSGSGSSGGGGGGFGGSSGGSW